MPIKPLERKNNWPVFIKLIFIGGLIISAVVIDKIFLKKTKEIPSVLGKTQEIELQTQEKKVGVGHDRPVQKNNFINDSIKKAEEVSGVVLGEAKSFVSNIIYENSIGKIVEQVDKLPRDQQEKIKEQICK